MNIPSYSNQDTSKSANNKNKIVIIAGVAIAVVIIGTVLAFILLKPSDSNATQPNITDNTEDSEIYAFYTLSFEVPKSGASFFILLSKAFASRSAKLSIILSICSFVSLAALTMLTQFVAAAVTIS